MPSVPHDSAQCTATDPTGERTADPTPALPQQVSGAMGTARSRVANAERAEPPTVLAFKVRRTRAGNRIVTIRCPWCGRKHLHGLPAGESTVGHRASHCTRDVNRVGYLILTPAGAL